MNINSYIHKNNEYFQSPLPIAIGPHGVYHLSGEMMGMKKKKAVSGAMGFILLFGIVSLFSDMTHEGAASIRGAYMALMGASTAKQRA